MEHTLKFHDLNITYFAEGEGTTVLFLHGWPTNAELWRLQMEHFRKRHRVVALDWLGFGASSHPSKGAYSFSRSQAILEALIPELVGENEQITIVAHDIGGPPAILYAAEHPDRIRSLILLNTVIYPFSTTVDRVSHFLFKIPGLNQLIVSDGGLRKIIQANTKSKRPGLKRQIEEVVDRNTDIPTHIRTMTILSPLALGKERELQHLAQTFSELNVDRQLVVARKDPLCYAHMEKLIAANPTVPVHEIENCGHYIPLDRPEELNQILELLLKH